jgi:hypothetical protein
LLPKKIINHWLIKINKWMNPWTLWRRRPPKSEQGCNFHARLADIASKLNTDTNAYWELLITHRLKCCRNYPCANCKKRGEAASCTYVGRGPRGKAQHGRSSPTLVQDRLHHLENLVMSLAQNQRPDPEINFNTRPENRAAYATPSPASCDPATESAPVDAGTLVVKNEGTSYIDSANWRAILEEVCFFLYLMISFG